MKKERVQLCWPQVAWHCRELLAVVVIEIIVVVVAVENSLKSS